MPFLSWLTSEIVEHFAGQAPERRTDGAFSEYIIINHKGKFSFKEQSFDDNYKFVRAMLKQRLDLKYPNGPYTRLRAGENTPHNYGADRALAVDTMSTAIAMALRDGATVQEAADAGAASVGI